MFWFAAPHGWALLPVVFTVTALGSVLVVNLQLRLMDVAGEAQTLGAAMNHASLNVANALGAWLGGLTIAPATATGRPRWSGSCSRSPVSRCSWSPGAWPDGRSTSPSRACVVGVACAS